ncbi:MAG TPA: MerR family transcriptional regulator [Acidimicrobiia bacterium]
MAYSALQAARLTGCSEAQLTYWERTGLVAPEDGEYGFRDLVALRVVASLLEAGLALGRVRQAVRYLLASGEDIAGLRLVTDGDRVWACRDDGQILDALRRGQMALFVAVDAFADAVGAEVRSFDAERREFVEGLHASSEP